MIPRSKSVAEERVTSVLKGDQVPVYEDANADDDVLAALGYKPEFKREFSLWTSFCVSFAVLGLLPSFASTLYYVRSHGVAGVLHLNTVVLTDTLARAWVTREPLEWSGDG